MSKPWIRLYRDAILKPKVGALALDDLGFWAACLMLSDDAGCIPTVKDLAWQLRLSEDEISSRVTVLLRNGLVTRYVTDGVTRHRLHDWDEHQRKSDHDASGAERQRLFRERKKSESSAENASVTEMSQSRNALRNGAVTPPDKIREDKIREEKKVLTTFVPKKISAPPDFAERSEVASKKTSGTRWPSDAVVPDEWLEAGHRARAEYGLSQANLSLAAVEFQNYWAGKSGAQATKVDWRKTWINWALRTKETGSGAGRSPTRASGTLNSILGQLAQNKSKVQSE